MQMKLTFDLYPNVIIETGTLDYIIIDTEMSPIALINTEILKNCFDKFAFFFNMLVAMETPKRRSSTIFFSVDF